MCGTYEGLTLTLSRQIPDSLLIDRDDVIVHSVTLLNWLLDTATGQDYWTRLLDTITGHALLQQRVTQHMITSHIRAFTATGCFDINNKMICQWIMIT